MRDSAFSLPIVISLARTIYYISLITTTRIVVETGRGQYCKCRSLQPDAGQTHLAQAIHSYWGYRDYDRAREALTKAQQSLPNDAQVFKFLGLIDRRQGRWNEALRNLERMVELDPRNADALGNLAQTYYDMRRYNESIATFDRIAQLEPGNPAVRTFRGSIELAAHAEVKPLRAVLNTIEAEGPDSAREGAALSFGFSLWMKTRS